MTTEYRVRWARITVCGRFDTHVERMCIAERRTRLFWLLPIWLPTTNADWRNSENQALLDIEEDRALHQPIPAPLYV
jgi:hypothetical protein